MLSLLGVYDFLEQDLVFGAHLLQGLLGPMVAGGFFASSEERHVMAIGEIQLGFFPNDVLNTLEIAFILVLLIESSS